MPNGLPVVVVDPGHGGDAMLGGSSPNNAHFGNLLEKTLTLDLAQRVERLVAPYARVLLTRRSDQNVSLADRARIAHDNHADIFLSIHLNGFSDASVDGTEVWVAAVPSPRSTHFAGDLLNRLVTVTGAPDRGVRKKDLGVLVPSRHASGTAACLAEVAFLSNPAEAHRLQDAAYLDRLAGAMADSVRSVVQPVASTHGATALDAIVGTGKAELDCPVLNSHRGVAAHNLILHWNAPPQSRSTIDVVVHLHGFGPVAKTLNFHAKERISGLDFHDPSGATQASRQRPTLGILPHGDRTGTGNYCGGDPCDAYDFPALTGGTASGLTKLIQFSLDAFATGQLSQPSGSLQADRTILTAHSGGGARLLTLLAHHDPHEVHLFDALYQAPTSAIAWVTRHIKDDASAAGVLSASERVNYMRTQGHALRAICIPVKHNTNLHEAIECALAAVSDTSLRGLLRNFYRVEQAPSGVGHNDIPKTFGWQWLVDASASVTPSPRSLPAPRTCTPARASALGLAPFEMMEQAVFAGALSLPAGVPPFEHTFQPLKPDTAGKSWVPDGLETKLVAPLNPGFVDTKDELVVTTPMQTMLADLLTRKGSPFRQHLTDDSILRCQPHGGDKLRIALVDLTEKKLTQPEFVAWGATPAVDAASSAKVGALYAAYQLMNDLQHVAAVEKITKVADLIAEMNKRWKKFSSPPTLARFLNSSANPPALDFSKEVRDAFANIIDHDNANHAGRVLIEIIGYPYIASLMWQSGLRHPKRGGLWLTTSYESGVPRWDDAPPMTPALAGGHTASALSLVTFFTLLEQGRLVNVASSKKMKAHLSTASFFDKSYWAATPLPSAQISSKVGLINACDRMVPKMENCKQVIKDGAPQQECAKTTSTLAHEAGIVENGKLKYAFAIMTVGVPDGIRVIQQLIAGLDGLIRARN